MRRTALVFCVCLVLAGCGGRRKGGGTAPEGTKEKRSDKTSVVIEGVRFDVEVKARELAKGWGVHITVRMSSDDGIDHYIESNPLLLAGSFTFHNKKYGFDEGGLMTYPPRRIRIKPGSKLRFSKDFPFDPKGEGILNGESLDLTVKILGMVSMEGTIITHEIATVKMEISKKGKPGLIVKPCSSY